MLTIIRNYTLDDIGKGIKYLLGKASEAPEVRMLAIEITGGSEDPISAIYNWVKTHVHYVPDPVSGTDTIELFISPVRMVKDFNAGTTIGGDCDDIALLTTALYRSIGIQANVVLVDQDGGGLDHAYCVVWSDKLQKWINSDPSAPELPLGWELQLASKIII